MTKLEWCRDHAPEALQGLPDGELLGLMSSAYEMFVTDKDVIIKQDNDVDLSTHEKQLDYMFETLVREFGDDLTFKGGYMLTKLLNNGFARRTEDIDFSILTDEIYDNIKIKLEEIGEFFTRKGIVSKYVVKPQVERTMSGGIKFYDSNGSNILGVDVGWHDTSYGVTHYKIDNIECKGFRTERMVGDKLLSILSRKRLRRAKDLYDLYIISEECNLNLALVHGCMLRRQDLFELWDNWPFSETVVREYKRAYGKLVITTVSGSVQRLVSFDEAYKRLSSLLPVIRKSTPNENYIWNSKSKLVSVT